jgi:hypothetical protein
MLIYTPKSEKELSESMLIPDGDYDFEVISATQKNSKANNPMIELKLKIWDSEGKERTVFDYLMSSTDSMLYKLRHFCVATKMEQIFDSGKLTDQDCIGKSGKVRIFVQQDKSGKYQPKNAVKDYLTPEKTEEFNDDIPW